MNDLSLGKEAKGTITFKAGAIIFAEGKPAKYLYLIKKGNVQLVKSQTQHLTVIGFCSDGDILNEIGVLTNTPQEYSAIAKTDTELVLIEQKDILSVINSGPSWIPDIFKTLCERLKATEEMIQEHSLGEKDKTLVISKEDEKKYMEALMVYNTKI